MRSAPVLPGPTTYMPAIPGPGIPMLEGLARRGGRRSIYAEFYDPAGMRFGLPTYPWKWAPPGWLTVRQLRAKGLRPGGQEPAGQVMWRHRKQRRHAYLYLQSLALPVRPMTPAKQRALDRALLARMTCISCGRVLPYCISKSLGECNDCADGAREWS